jgi:integrase
MYSSHMPREGARPEIVRDNMGHANIAMTQNVYGKSAGCLAKFRSED